MKIENQKIVMPPVNIQQLEMTRTWNGARTKSLFRLTEEQIQFIKFVRNGHSISSYVLECINQGLIPNFALLKEFIQFLVAEGEIRNVEFAHYFSEEPEEEVPRLFVLAMEKLLALGKPIPTLDSIRNDLIKSPFFRSIPEPVTDLLLSKGKILKSVAGVPVCQANTNQRSLFFLIKGQCGVYRSRGAKFKRKIATLSEGAVFGEVGFFLGEVRTADVITESDCLILKISYDEEKFGPLIKKDTARNLQSRFFLIHALLRSRLFRQLPDDCLDAIIGAGVVENFPAENVILKENSLGDACYVTIQGQLVVSKGGKSIRVLTQGDVFGEIALLLSGGRRTASVHTQTETMLLRLSREPFYRLLAENLFLACEFQKVATERLSDNESSVDNANSGR